MMYSTLYYTIYFSPTALNSSTSPPQIVVMICGFAEVLMGFQLARDPLENSTSIYVPFWQGALVKEPFTSFACL